ncbi:M42 family metallopeptidase [Halorutilales archaeon Cl-col2-1]
MDDDSLDFLRRLVETPSPSGFEIPNLENWRERVGDFADEIETDAYGNTTATLNPGCDTSVVVTGHADEIGFMVRYITDDGYIYVERIGGIDPGVAEGQRVTVHTRDNGEDIKGVVGRKPIHLQEDEDREKVPDLEELWIDIGADDREDVEDAGVSVGDPVTYDVGFERLQGDVVAGRGIDNRIGIWVAAEVLRAVDPEKLDVTLHAVATVQEEVGLKGAQMVGYDLDPDVALVVDVTFATDMPGLSGKKHGEINLGEGPALKHGRENHPRVLEHLQTVSDSRGIELQNEPMMTRGGTDADAFYVSRGGIASASVGVPNRYMHTPSEVVSLTDLEDARDLFAGFVEELDPDESLRRI